MSVLLAPDEPTVVRTGPVDASVPPGLAREPIRLGVSQALLALALVAVWLVVYLTVLSGFEQGHAQKGLYDRVRTELALGTAPMSAGAPAGTPIAVLDVPALGISNLVVVEGTRAEQTADGPGHLLGSVLPGQQGVSVLMGRSLAFGAPFADLPRLRVGDRILVTTGQGRFTYTVNGVRRRGDPVPAALQAKEGRLSLVTAAGDGRFGALAPGDTVYVDAVLADAAPAGVVGTRDPVSPMEVHVSAGTLAELALALQLLLGALVATVWAWQRWSHRGAWIAGAPVVLAAAWLCSSLASQFLPALV
ncbi:sortase [Nocardioides sp. URHA0020]|uniref:sortase n=1 Tax=Nocardioides sp. URHA0020 TaxID=1380392 RepID=UPI000AB32809|nr:class E sortase [Nocardioides sp. URHA0020]